MSISRHTATNPKELKSTEIHTRTHAHIHMKKKTHLFCREQFIFIKSKWSKTITVLWLDCQVDVKWYKYAFPNATFFSLPDSRLVLLPFTNRIVIWIYLFIWICRKRHAINASTNTCKQLIIKKRILLFRIWSHKAASVPSLFCLIFIAYKCRKWIKNLNGCDFCSKWNPNWKLNLARFAIFPLN